MLGLGLLVRNQNIMCLTWHWCWNRNTANIWIFRDNTYINNQTKQIALFPCWVL